MYVCFVKPRAEAMIVMDEPIFFEVDSSSSSYARQQEQYQTAAAALA
jgi:hypothetical protein